MSADQLMAIKPDLDEPAAGNLMIAYGPTDDVEVYENPPRFTWIAVLDSDARYVLQVARNPDFTRDQTEVFTDIHTNFFTPPKTFTAGLYYWRYAVWNPETEEPATTWSSVRAFTLPETTWSSVRAFTLPDSATGPALPERHDRYRQIERSHPRLWLNADGLTAFKAALAKDPDHCGWQRFYEKSVLPWVEREVITELPPYPGNVRVAEVWRASYILCQEVLYAIRHLAIAGRVLDDEQLIARAKDWLLSVAAWNPKGTTSHAYTDEWAFRITTALAWGYDWLYDAMSETERETVRTALTTRAEEIADHVMYRANIHLFPYDSHAVRALSATLTPACIALLDDEPKATAWFDHTLDFLFTVYSPWGGRDGGWAEGPHYWMTGIAYLIEAANLIRNFMQLDLYARPFFQRTGNFPLYTKPPGTRRACFGDDSTMGDLPCLKVGYNLRQFAGVTGNGHYQWYFEQLQKDDPGTAMLFYNYGWWDFNFDDLVYAHDFPEVTAEPPHDMPKLAWFRDVGWAGIQHRMDDPSLNIQFLIKSSPYGSVSHSHGDQCAFQMSAFGEDLAIQSGYYVAFNSSMHRDWRRQTRSKNAILIDGNGQYAGANKALAIKAKGEIMEAEEREDHVYIRADATPAHAIVNPSIQRYEREVYFVHDSYFVIIDRVETDAPVTIDWRLHTMEAMELGRETFRYTGERAGFYGQFIYSAGGRPTLAQVEGYEGVNEDEIEGLAKQWYLSAQFPADQSHLIATLLVPYPKAAPKRLFHFTDDQGYTANLYITDKDDRQFKIVMPKTFKLT